MQLDFQSAMIHDEPRLNWLSGDGMVSMATLLYELETHLDKHGCPFTFLLDFTWNKTWWISLSSLWETI